MVWAGTQICAARGGAIMWRLRRQVFGAIIVAVSLCLFYFEFVAEESVTVSRQQQDAGLRRDLNSLGQADLLKSATNDNGKPERIKFVAKNKEQLEQQQQILNRVKNPTVEGVIQQAAVHEKPSGGQSPDYGRNNYLAVGSGLPRDQAVQRALDRMPDTRLVPPNPPSNEYPPPPPAPVVMRFDESFGGSPWSGHYKYNTYGEPVYGRTDRPNYIPKERVIHLDLKGAPIDIRVLKALIPWMARHQATAILIEYEDTFPYSDNLSQTAARNHYTARQIQELVQLCEKYRLEVIPLVQTFGHLEFVLKHDKFSHLREVPEIPQALCPSRNESLKLLYSMIDQTMSLHPNSRYVHIGCDEVFHMGECELCRQVARENLFLQHVTTVAKYITTKYGSKVLIWDDMLRHISELTMRDYRLGELVEPVVWVYAEDIYRFVQPYLWTKYSQVFSYVWAASAFKGAFGEQLTVPNVRRHLDNHLNWLDVMATESSKFAGGFRGLVLTGWQRYDHFAVLCELFPAAMPSLAVNLITVSHGFFNNSIQTELYSALECGQSSATQTWINLDNDPFLYDKFSWCSFPGKQVFSLSSRLDITRRDVDSYIERMTRSRAWITDYNRRHNFSSPMRINEDLEEMPVRLHSVSALAKAAREALAEWFDEWTVGEWVEQHIWPMYAKLETLQKESESMKLRKSWPARPLPILPELAQFGITEPSSSGNKLNSVDANRSRSKYQLMT